MSRGAASISVSFHVLSCRRPLFLVRALTTPGLRGSQPVVKVQLHSAGDASPLHPTAHSPRRGGPGLTALLLPYIFPIFSVVAPCQRGASPASVRRWTFTTDCYVLAGPVQDDVGDLEVIRPEHHHVGRAVEDRVPELVQLDVVRLRRALPGGAPAFDGVDGRVAHFTRRRV